MSLPLGYIPRKGDIVAVRAEVRFDVNQDDDGELDDDGARQLHAHVLLNGYADARVPLSHVRDLIHRDYKVGEVVHVFDRIDPMTSIGKAVVAGVYEDFVWIKLDSTGALETVKVGIVRPLSKKEQAAETEPVAARLEDLGR